MTKTSKGWKKHAAKIATANAVDAIFWSLRQIAEGNFDEAARGLKIAEAFADEALGA